MNHNYLTSYLILGANAAGMSAAVRILKFDKQAKVTVLDQSDVVSFGNCGITYYVGGEFDDIEKMTARPLQEFIKLGIDIQLFHTATQIDPLQKRVTVQYSGNQVKTFQYDKLLIAVGASPTHPPIKGLDAKGVHTVHTKYDAQAIVNALPDSQRVVIIGAGFIGLEAAEAFVARGKQVTVIEFADRVLAQTYDLEMTCHLEQALQRHGVRLQLNEKVSELLSEQGIVKSVRTDRAEYPADLVIVATGFKPNTDFLRSTGIKLSPQGAIVIDDRCRTNLADIYAAGDCATVKHKISGDVYIPLATTANKLGRIAGEVMAGGAHKPFIGTLGSAGIRVFDMEAGRTGITEAEVKQLGIDYAVSVIQDKNFASYMPGQTDMWVKLIFDRQTRQLLGGQICGSYSAGAVLRVDALAVAVYSGLTVDELGQMDFIYAPPFARTWDVLNVAGNVAGNVK